MTTAELMELIADLRSAKTDLAHVEAKRAEGGLPKRLWQTLSAFANTREGGVLILGLDESADFKVSSISDPARLHQDLASLCGEMEPPIRAKIELHQVEGATLVVAEIPEIDLNQKPCYYPGAGLTNGAYIRVADGDRKLSGYEVQMLLASRGQPREDEAAVPGATPADLDRRLVTGLLRRLKRSEGSPFHRMSEEEALRTLRVLVPDPAARDRRVPSIGGLLALGKYPQKFLPSLDVTFVSYPTPHVGEPGPGGKRFLDNRRFDGPVPRIVTQALAALRTNMKRRAIMRGIFREDLWEYPEAAVREALVNALAHRDLSAAARGMPVQVMMFPDRLVIQNAGGLFGPVTVDQLGEAGVCSARNQVLMKLLEDTCVPGEDQAICENRGSGIGAMLAALRQAGMSPPEFEDHISTFRVTFPNHSLLDEATLSWLRGVGAVDLTDSQRIGLALLRRGDVLTNALYRQATGLDSRVATRELGELVDRGVVVQSGTRRWANYQLGNAVPVTAAPVAETAPPARPRQRADRRPEILALLRARGPLARVEIARALGLSRQAILRWLTVLRSSGQIQLTTAHARSPGARYRLSP